MESKVIPTPEEFRDQYAISKDYASWLTMISYLTAIDVNNSIIKHFDDCMHEYAVLFAKHHAAECKEQIKDAVVNQAFNLKIHKQLVESLEYIAEKSFDIDNIR